MSFFVVYLMSLQDKFDKVIFLWYTTYRHLGGVAQLGERLLCTQKVSGSTPLISIRVAAHNTLVTHPVFEKRERQLSDFAKY